MITYDQTQENHVNVRLDGRLVGTVEKEKLGWIYYPLGHKTGGLHYPTLAECQKSLED